MIKKTPIIEIHFNLDTDRDGVPDYKDCRPFDPKRHFIGGLEGLEGLAPGTEIGRATVLEGPTDYGAGHMPVAQTADLMYGLELVLHGKDKGKIRKKKSKK